MRPGSSFPRGSSGEEPTSKFRRRKRYVFNPWVRKIPWRRAWQPTPVFLPGEFHRQRSLVGYGPWGSKESETTEATAHKYKWDQECLWPLWIWCKIFYLCQGQSHFRATSQPQVQLKWRNTSESSTELLQTQTPQTPPQAWKGRISARESQLFRGSTSG